MTAAPPTGRLPARWAWRAARWPLTLERVAAAGLGWPLPETLTDRVLEAMLFAGTGSRQGCRRKAEPDWAHVHRELRRPASR